MPTKKTKAIFAELIKETKKLKKSKKDQIPTCGKVVCYRSDFNH